MLKDFIKNLKKYKNYIFYQTRAEIKSEITGSRLGMLWIIIEPLAFMLVYTFIGEIVFNKSTEYFPIFIYSGLMMWNFFNRTIKKSTRLVSAYKEVVSKIYVPKYIFLIITILSNLFKLLITFCLLVLFMIVYQVPVTINILWAIPVIINLTLITFGISLFFMHFGVIITDLVNATNILMKFLFYFTGIFYSIQDAIPTPYNTILYLINPITFLITEFRNTFIYSEMLNIIWFVIWFVVGIVLSYFGIKKIQKNENTYVKVMG